MGEREMLWEKARNLRSQMRKLGPLLKGSLVFREMKCGKPNCTCTRGKPHSFLCITYKERGKTKTVYVDKARQEEALSWSANYKKFKFLLNQHTQILFSLLKSQAYARRKAAYIKTSAAMASACRQGRMKKNG
ncbi:MAG: DUF6788 family protein [Candidatus Omnitrophota bacterium]